MIAHGVVYIVTRSRPHLDEAVFSARSLRRCSPDVPATLFTDLPLGADAAAFDRVVPVLADEHPLKLKVRLLAASPYRRTLFLDADTEILRDVAPAFAALDGHDFAICHSPDVDMRLEDPAVRAAADRPGFFHGYENPHLYNTGVFLYADSPAASRLLDRWYAAVRRQDDAAMRPGHHCDQTCFQTVLREAAARHPLRLRVLDNRVWNARSYLYPYLERDGLLDAIAIYHGRPPLSQQRGASLARPMPLE